MPETARPSPKRVSLPFLLLLLPWVAVVSKAFGPITDNSYLWHIRAGHVQQGAAAVLTTDPFSFTSGGESWLTQSWLAELFYGVAEDVFGIGFTGVMLAVFSLLTVIGLGLLIFRVSGSLPATAVVLTISTLMLLSFLVPRPVLFSYPLFVLVILAWDKPELRWSIPFLMWLWASVHGSFAIGLVYLALMTLARREWRAWPHLLAGGLATLVTAHGLGVFIILTEFLTARPYLALISEWRTPNFLSVALGAFLVGLVLIVYGAMKGRLTTAMLWILVPFLVLAMSATRAVAIAFLALVPMVAMSLKGMTWRLGSGFARPVGLGAILVMLALPFLFIEASTVSDTRFPLDARAHLNDVHTFHDDTAGGYLIYVDQFSDGVFLDDRAELHRELMKEFVEVRALREPWEPLFEREGIVQALLRADERLIEELKDAGWGIAHEDEEFVVLRP